MKRFDIINHFIRTRNYQSFLEIGTDRGETFRNVIAECKYSVDPDPATNPTFCMTSDEFFRHNFQGADWMHFDIIFIDGLHEAHQVYSDIRNALLCLNECGVIVLHDCLPTTEAMQVPHNESQRGYAWTGDVWKAFVKVRTEIPFRMYTMNTDFGCGVIDTAHIVQPRDDLPDDIDTMTYDDFVRNRNDWMNVKEMIPND